MKIHITIEILDPAEAKEALKLLRKGWGYKGENPNGYTGVGDDVEITASHPDACSGTLGYGKVISVRRGK